MAVFAAQTSVTWTATHGLDYLKSRFGASAMGIDAVAIAPYLGVRADPDSADTYTSMTLGALADYLRGTVPPQAIGFTTAYRQCR